MHSENFPVSRTVRTATEKVRFSGRKTSDNLEEQGLVNMAKVNSFQLRSFNLRLTGFEVCDGVLLYNLIP